LWPLTMLPGVMRAGVSVFVVSARIDPIANDAIGEERGKQS
jgi:hypothetical protein